MPNRKKSAPPPKRRRGSKIENLRAEVGQVSDALIAQKAGVSVEGVLLYRRRHGITLDPDAHLRQSLMPSNSLSSLHGELDGDADGDDGRRGRRSKIDPFLDQVGKVPDTEIANLAEVSVDAVRMYRRKFNIPATWNDTVTDENGDPLPPLRAVLPSAPSQAATLTALAVHSRGKLQGYAISVQHSGGTTELIMLASNIADAAARAVQKSGGEVVAVRHLGPALL